MLATVIKKSHLKLIIIILVVSFPIIVSGQVYDTIPYFDGTFQIISKTEKEGRDSFVKAGGGHFRANYKIIDSSGIVIKESKFDVFREEGTVEIIKINGQKSWEQYIFKNSITSKKYYENGNLRFEESNFFNEFFGIKETRMYYDNELNSIKKITFEELIVPDSFEGITIEEWRIEARNLMETILIEQEVEGNIYLPIRVIYFYQNGKIKEKGEYSKRRFFEFRNKDYYQEWLKNGEPYIGNYAVILNQRVKVKNGKWQYFDKEGNLIKTEFYDNGILRNKK